MFKGLEQIISVWLDQHGYFITILAIRQACKDLGWVVGYHGKKRLEERSWTEREREKTEGDAGCCKWRAPAASPPPAAAAAVLFLQPACYRSHTQSRGDEKVQRGVQQPCSEEKNLITDIEPRICFSRVADLRRKDL